MRMLFYCFYMAKINYQINNYMSKVPTSRTTMMAQTSYIDNAQDKIMEMLHGLIWIIMKVIIREIIRIYKLTFRMRFSGFNKG